MRLSTLAILLCHGVVSVIAASSTSSSASPAVTAPICGLLCITKETLKSTCSITNTTCICTNDDLRGKIQTCLLSNCTIVEALQSEKYSYSTCGIEGQDRTALVWHLGIAFMITGLAAFGLRCLERLRSHTWGLDDWAITAVAIILVPMCAITIPLSQAGLGLDMWNVSQYNINQVLYYFYCEEILYAVALALNKISILLFYLRVFPQQNFRIVVYVFIVLETCYALAFGLAVILQCHPIDGAWKGWDGEYEGDCVDVNYLGWSGAGINIFFDVATLVLPMHVLAQLTMSMKKKIQILAMFAVGFFVTLVSCLRLRSMIEFGSTKNVTQDYVEVGYWSTIEISIGIVCACMPAIRALLDRTFPFVFGSSRSGDSDARSPHAFSSKKSGSRKLDKSETSSAVDGAGVPEGMYGSKNKSKRQSRYSRYGTSTEITVLNEWAVVDNPANRSDVELVSMEKKLGFKSDAGYVNSSRRPDPDQWSAESEMMGGPPIQNR